MDSVSVIDQPLVLDAVRTLVLDTFTAYQEGSQIKWNDAELAVYLVYVFGEVNKCKSCSLSSLAERLLIPCSHLKQRKSGILRSPSGREGSTPRL